MSLLKRLEQENKNNNKDNGSEINKETGSIRNQQQKTDDYEELKMSLLRKVIDILEQNNKNNSDEEKVKEDIATAVNKILIDEEIGMTRIEKSKLISEIIDECIGFGPINPLLKDNSVSEIMVNGKDHVYAEHKGKLQRMPIKFRDDRHIMQVIEKIVSPLGRRIDESSPMVDARLPDGSRVNAIIPPLALNGPVITIRKFSEDPFTINDLIGFGTLNAKMATFLKECVKNKLNIIVSGGTGSGKTTTLNVLSSFISNTERIVTIEDAAELQLKQDHVVRLESRPRNIEGKGEISIRDLVKNSLRMRPDRIVVGEVRGGEALDMLQAMNTGHDGSLTTGHANTPRDMLARLETMVLMAGMDLPVRAIREQVSSAVDMIVQQSRLKDGSRKITYITEVLGMEGDVITMQDIFLYKEADINKGGDVQGKFIFTGLRPKMLENKNSAELNALFE